MKRFEHYKFHEEQQQNYSLYSEELAFANSANSNNSIGSFPVDSHNGNKVNFQSTNKQQHEQQSMANTIAAAISTSTTTTTPVTLSGINSVERFNNSFNNVKINRNKQCNSVSSSSSSSSQSTKNHSNTTNNSSSKKSSKIFHPEVLPVQVFPTGSALTSADGMPILKRKRGRPPKNRTGNDLLGTTGKTTNNNNKINNNSFNNSNLPPLPYSLSSMSTLELAQAFNLPLNHANIMANIGQQNADHDLSKTIPIPLIMPYIKSSIHIGFYVFDKETLCPDVTCIYLGQKHFHCSKPRCYYSTNRDDILLEHSKDFHDNVDILEGFVYFDENIDCKSTTTNCLFNKKSKHFHCTRAGCNFTFDRYSMMNSHEEKHYQENLQSNLHDIHEDFNDKSDESQCSPIRPPDDNHKYNFSDDDDVVDDVDDDDDDNQHNLKVNIYFITYANNNENLI